jgi:hypothetical protein
MVLYELLAGQHPLRGIGKSIASGPIVDLRELRSDCPPAVAQFFVRALSPRAEERSETATEFRAGLSVLLEDEPRTYVASA